MKESEGVPLFDANGDKFIKIKHFPIDNEYSFVQYTARMTEDDYKVLVRGDAAHQENYEPGKDRILIQCLDTSGSMAGAPMRALQ